MTRAFVQYEVAPTQQAFAPGVAGRERCIFVSYSHDDCASGADRDGDWPRKFYDELVGLCKDYTQYGIKRDGIFFDRNGLLPGMKWAPEIASALARSEIVFFLVSDHSLKSDFCMEQEVGAAVAAGKTLVPVILTDCRWTDRVVVAGQQRFRLGDFQAVPKDEKFRLRPVELWQHKSSAWRAVIEQIQSLLASLPALPAPLADARLDETLQPLEAGPKASGAGLPQSAQQVTPAELLPFTCNQTAVAQHFRLKLRPWRDQALLVLLKGVYDDELPSFMRRLAELDLAPRCAKAGLALLERRIVKDWPTEDCSLLPEYVQMALGGALTGDVDSVVDGASLSQALAQQPGMRPLLLGVLDGGPVLGKALQAALSLIEAAPVDAPLRRLALVLTLEDEDLAANADAAGSLDLLRFQRTHVIELSRMQALEGDDVARWFDEHELQVHFSEGRQSFVKQIFAGQSELRMRPFAQAARKLLTLR